MDIFELIKELTTGDGVSGSSDGFLTYAENILKKYCRETHIDKAGNVIGFIPCGKKNAKKLMVEAHYDRIGLMVKNIDENGFIEFDVVGGVDKRILPSAEVLVLGREKLFGVIGAKPPHLREKKDENKIDAKDMLIDVGMSFDEVSELVSIGDFIVLYQEPVRLINNRISGAALDNRAGMASVICFLEKLSGLAIEYDLYPVFTSGEECGLIGAYSAAFVINPDISVSVDATFGKSENDNAPSGTFELGCGAVIFRGPDTSYEGSLNLIKRAKEKGIPYDIEAAGSSGTNAAAIQNARGAAETYLLSVPVKYMHQTVEMLSASDVEAVADLILEIAVGGVLSA